MKIVHEALGSYGCMDAISMVSGREAVGDLLKMDEYIDLVIPRGSGELVKHIKEQSKMIPVLGHAEGKYSIYLYTINYIIYLIIIIVYASNRCLPCLY